ncbi:MAG TPA: ATP-binding protein [Gemmataceae bacterium]|nr:ATP-binding protein [Gemmataceae bacterium]
MMEEYKRALAASEARFRNLIEKTADGVVVVSADGMICYVNPAAETLLGRRSGELLGAPFGRPLTAGETAEIDLCPAPRGDRLSFLVVEMRVVEIDWEGQPAFLATLRDITERKEAVRRRDEFLAMLAHELRNPLAPILNAVHLMRLRGLPTAELERARAIIERQGEHLARLLDDLLDLSRVTHGKIELRKQVVDLRAILTNAVQTSRSSIEQNHQQLTTVLPEEPLFMEADPTRLTQVIVNLLNNASKYTEPGGRIAITLCREDSQAVLSVKDTGQGIPPGQLASIFEPFTQLDASLDRTRGGLGLGLALVRRLVDLHGGMIAAFSDGPGKGSEFVVHLPIGEQAQSDRRDAGPTKEGVRRVSRRSDACSILLVEDNQDGREMLRDLLRSWGHRVEEVGDGLEGLNAIRRQAPDVALVDVGLPGLDGYELARQVRALPDGGKVRLIAVTGYGQPDDRRRALEAGFDMHFVKPVDLEKLEQLLAELPSDSLRFQNQPDA